MDHMKEDVDYMTWAIRSGIAGLIVILLSLVVWLATDKNSAVVGALTKLETAQLVNRNLAVESDRKILEKLDTICTRIGNVEGRVNNLEIFIQMPFAQRQKLFESFKYTGPNAIKNKPD